MKAPRYYVHRWPWDVLIILDACRRDEFIRLNRLEGKLTPIEVEVSYTTAWLKTYWKGWYPYTYVSGNPVVNSKYPVLGYMPRRHIMNIIDVWDWGWDEELLTVPPWNVTKEAVKYLNRRKVVVHYIQPHFPTIGKTRIRMGAWKPSKPSIVLDVEDEVTPEKARGAHEENLKIVLREVEENLLPHVPRGRRVVITSDHGDLLGEKGRYSHPGTPEAEAEVKSDPELWRILTSVFWFELEQI